MSEEEKNKMNLQQIAERYKVTQEVVKAHFLPLGLPYEIEKGGMLIFDISTVIQWEMQKKCIGCGNGLPGCGLLPAYRDSLFYRKKNPAMFALYFLCFVLSAFQAICAPNPIFGYAALSVFTVCLYDQTMRKGERQK